MFRIVFDVTLLARQVFIRGCILLPVDSNIVYLPRLKAGGGATANVEDSEIQRRITR